MLDILDKILELLENKDFPQLGNLLKDMNPADVAELFEDLPREKMALVFRLLPKELAADAFAYMNPDEQTVLVEAFSDKELHDVVNELYVDDAADMIEEMPANLVKRILRHTDAETRVLINQILNYPKDSAGSIMTMEYVDLKRGIRAIGVEKETVYTCYVTDSRRKLKGIVTVKDLLLAPKNELIRNIMETNIIYVSTHTDKEEVASLFGKYDFLAVPVVDNEERLVGIVTVDDAIDVIQDEATEDIEMMAAITPGSQASVSIIRGLSLGEIEYKDIGRILWKEARVAFLCGVSLAAANFVKLLLIDRVTIPVAIVVCSTLVVTVLAAKLVGCSLPVLAKRIGFDPAVMASPFITTIVDALSLLIYFRIACAVLHIG